MLGHCQESGGDETGGILIGHYNQGLNYAVVTRVTGPPGDSRGFPRLFQRGTKGLQILLQRIWRGGQEFYLGEWHFHPGAVPCPSALDRAQMKDIAISAAYRCPEPILMIVGGSPAEGWTASVAVFPQGNFIQLSPINGDLEGARLVDAPVSQHSAN